MSQGARQQNLFAAEDFAVVYQSFKQANFQAYDYDSIRAALVAYIQQNYPENFNDWIQSSEFVALIETLSFLAHSLAFRIDLAGRENFLSTAERRASVLKIADFLGYTPKRHTPASGLLKVTAIRTTQNVFDIDGETLKSKTVDFVSDQQNFLLIMNEVLQASNRFGRTKENTTINGVRTGVYATNISPTRQVVFPITGNINGFSESFEVHGLQVDKTRNTLIETPPEQGSSFDMVYRNDNQGLASRNTGFFVGVKQGRLQYSDYDAATAISNLIIPLNARNVNENDIWVQEINSIGEVQDSWVKVDSSFGANTVFNNIRHDIRKLFTIKTQDNDAIDFMFGDGVFSEIPRGIIRLWYRTGLNKSYMLAPEDIGTTSISFDYIATDGDTYKVVLQLEMQQSISNASSQETTTSIKQNAGRAFAAQDRMITASDYSTLPLTASENVKKIKAINRTYVGHSRYIKANDPTAQYQNVDMLVRDGYLYVKPVLYRTTHELPSILTNEQIYERFVANTISNPEIMNLFYNRYEPEYLNYFANDIASYEWQQITKGYNGSTGYLTKNSIIQRAGSTAATILSAIRPNSMIEFIDAPYNDGAIGANGDEIPLTNTGTGYTTIPTVTIRGTGINATASATISAGQVSAVTITNAGTGYQNPISIEITGGGGTGATASITANSATTTWARVVDIISDGLGIFDDNGDATGLTSRGQGAIVLNKAIPNTARIRRIFYGLNTIFSADERTAIIDQIANKNTFGIRFDNIASSWKIISANNLPLTANNNPTNFSLTFAGDDTGNNRDASWLVRVDYTSDNWNIISRRHQFIFGSDDAVKFYNQNSKKKFNTDTNKPERDKITISGINYGPSGSRYPIGKDVNFFVYKYFTETDGYTDDRKLIVTLSDVDNDNYPDDPMGFRALVADDTINVAASTENGFTYTYRADLGTSVSGRKDLTFVWRRVSNSNYRVDPSLSNIIDIFVLNKNYDDTYRQWLANSRKITTIPQAPSISDLATQFSNIDSKKAVSDTIIYQSAEYKILFGGLADPEMQGKFRVIPVTGSTVTQTALKTKVIKAIHEFFDIDNWDFGDTFYFTELSAYIHQQCAGLVSSVVLIPTQEQSVFGDLFQITPKTYELFIPDVTTADIEITTTLLSI
jgi:hypothetical protein